MEIPRAASGPPVPPCRHFAHESANSLLKKGNGSEPSRKRGLARRYSRKRGLARSYSRRACTLFRETLGDVPVPFFNSLLTAPFHPRLRQSLHRPRRAKCYRLERTLGEWRFQRRKIDALSRHTISPFLLSDAAHPRDRKAEGPFAEKESSR
jgi:hypothetical protein